MHNLLINFFPLLAMPGGPELLVIVVVVILFFGGKKIPQLMGGIGRGIREYKNGKNESKNIGD